MLELTNHRFIASHVFTPIGNVDLIKHANSTQEDPEVALQHDFSSKNEMEYIMSL